MFKREQGLKNRAKNDIYLLFFSTKRIQICMKNIHESRLSNLSCVSSLSHILHTVTQIYTVLFFKNLSWTNVDLILARIVHQAPGKIVPKCKFLPFRNVKNEGFGNNGSLISYKIQILPLNRCKSQNLTNDCLDFGHCTCLVCSRVLVHGIYSQKLSPYANSFMIYPLLPLTIQCSYMKYATFQNNMMSLEFYHVGQKNVCDNLNKDKGRLRFCSQMVLVMSDI